eukprot:scaffold330212_cov70-Tisochrysis_lutea.AAC.3
MICQSARRKAAARRAGPGRAIVDIRALSNPMRATGGLGMAHNRPKIGLGHICLAFIILLQLLPWSSQA